MSYRLCNGVSKLNMGDKLVLMTQEGKIVTLQGTSSFILERILAGIEVESIASEMEGKYIIEISKSELMSDVLLFFAELIDLRIIEQQ